MYSFQLSLLKAHGADRVEASSVAVPMNIGTYLGNWVLRMAVNQEMEAVLFWF